MKPARVGAGALWIAALGAGGCGPRLDVGSDLLWTARFETNNFDEWTASRFGGAVGATPAPPNTIAVSNARPHAAPTPPCSRSTPARTTPWRSASMSLKENLPADAFYSAWYYLPHSTTVNGYWVIQKFRRRTDPADPSTEGELFDLDLYTLPSGEMSIPPLRSPDRLQPADARRPAVVPVDGWFHVEARYRNATDATGRLTVWLGRPRSPRRRRPTAPCPWIEWAVTSLGQRPDTSCNVLYVDDCAIARGPHRPQRAVAGP